MALSLIPGQREHRADGRPEGLRPWERDGEREVQRERDGGMESK